MRAPGHALFGRSSAALWVAVIALLGGPGPLAAGAGVDMFMRTTGPTGVTGESTDPTHLGDIEILSYEWSANLIVTITGPINASQSTFSDITVTKRVDKSSSKLMLQTFTLLPFSTVTLFVRSQGASPLEFLTITLQNVTVSSIRQLATSADSATESITLHYDLIKVQYVSLKADGTTGLTNYRTWNIKTQSGS